jgi:hypothetical protein
MSRLANCVCGINLWPPGVLQTTRIISCPSGGGGEKISDRDLPNNSSWGPDG